MDAACGGQPCGAIKRTRTLVVRSEQPTQDKLSVTGRTIIPTRKTRQGVDAHQTLCTSTSTSLDTPDYPIVSEISPYQLKLLVVCPKLHPQASSGARESLPAVHFIPQSTADGSSTEPQLQNSLRVISLCPQCRFMVVIPLC